MSTEQLRQAAVCGSVFRTWAAETSGLAPTIYPGMTVEVGKQRVWFEVWVQSWTAGPQRIHGPEQLTVLITVQIFCRPGTQPGEVQQLADRARAIWRHRQLEIREYDVSDAPLLGRLVLQEPEVRDLSRGDADPERLLHLLVSCRGSAVVCE